MATIFELIAGFFTGKTYRAKDFARSHKALITSGVLADDLETFQVVPSAGMTVAVKPGSGYCWIEGHYGELEATAALTLTTADGVLNRIDRIVARLDTANAKITLTVLTGTTAVTPAAPAITRDGTVYDLCLASIYVAKGTTTVTTAMITDTRADSSLCGGCLVRSADLLVLSGKADKVYVDATFATKSEITAGTLKANANRILGVSVTNPYANPSDNIGQGLIYNGSTYSPYSISMVKLLKTSLTADANSINIPISSLMNYSKANRIVVDFWGWATVPTGTLTSDVVAELNSVAYPWAAIYTTTALSAITVSSSNNPTVPIGLLAGPGVNTMECHMTITLLIKPSTRRQCIEFEFSSFYAGTPYVLRQGVAYQSTISYPLTYIKIYLSNSAALFSADFSGEITIYGG